MILRTAHSIDLISNLIEPRFAHEREHMELPLPFLTPHLIFAFQIMNFASTMMNSVLETMNYVLQTMDFIFQMQERTLDSMSS